MSPRGKNTKSCWSWPFAASQSGALGGLRSFWLAVSSKQELRDLSASDSRRSSHCSVCMHIHACMQLLFVSVSQQAVQHNVGPLLTTEIKSEKQKRRGEIIQHFKKISPIHSVKHIRTLHSADKNIHSESDLTLFLLHLKTVVCLQPWTYLCVMMEIFLMSFWGYTCSLSIPWKLSLGRLVNPRLLHF